MDSLFPDELKVLTDESATENGNNCFKKIPNCCNILGVDTLYSRIAGRYYRRQARSDS